MLQSRLDKEGVSFWNSHDYQKALIILNKLKGFWGSDFSLYPNKLLLTGHIQLISYLGRNNLNIENINQNITYEFLINNFANYWNQRAQEFNDYQKKLDAITETNVFKNLIKSITGVLNILSNPIFAFASLGVLLLYLFKKK